MHYNISGVATDDNRHKIACNFDPDNDGFIPDFFMELKNKPGCLASLNIVGVPGLSSTTVCRISGGQ